MIEQDDVMNVLKEIINPELNVSIVNEGIVKEVRVNKNIVTIIMSARYAGTPMAEYFTDLIKQKVEILPEVDEAKVEFTGE